MKASVVLHLPGLASLMQIPKLISTVQKLGLTLRGSYGEGASAKGDMFQLSNSITLGISEKAAIENLKSIALQIAAQERAAREERNPQTGASMTIAASKSPKFKAGKALKDAIN